MIKKLVFVSNFYNAHQKFISDEFYKILGDGYTFIETVEMSDDWKRKFIFQTPPYVLKSYVSKENFERSLQLISDADAVIFGSADEKYLKERLKNNKLAFRYSERLFKGNNRIITLFKRFVSYHIRNPKKKNFYLLAASAYTPIDFKRLHLFKNKMFKWGYFPEVREYKNVEKLVKSKEEKSILWCGRIIDWKRLEEAILAINNLIELGYTFKFNVIGDGSHKDNILNLVKKLGIEKDVIF